jgi:phosphocarrier protein
MVREVLILTNKLGLHARAAAKLVQMASGFDCDIRLVRDGRQANAKSIMGVMMLAAAKGTTLELIADGPEELAAVEGISRLIAERFGEDE